MSNIVSAAVYPLQMPPTPKAVLVSMADNANDFGECWPSISTICMRTCFGKTAVIEAIKWLEQQGMIVADRGPRGTGTRYTILAGRVNDLFVPQGSSGGGPVRRRNVRQLFPNQSGRRTTSGAGTHDQGANRFALRTSPADAPVREADTGSSSGEHDQSGSRSGVVRQADPNHQEPSASTSEPSSAQARDDDEEQLPVTEIDRVLSVFPVEQIPHGLSRNTLARFIRHRAVLRKPVSIPAWFELRARFAELQRGGHDLNRSLRETMLAGLAIPVTPKAPGESNAASSQRTAGLGQRVAANAERALRASGGGTVLDGTAVREEHRDALGSPD